MCGIAGFWAPDTEVPGATEILRRMTDAIRHRGPDADGHWSDPHAGIFLGHRRLSIIDLTPTGSQPMVSGDGSLILTFNGEIYNFSELRAELEARGIRFRGHSDTEVLVEGMALWGVETTVRRAAGMFAFAVWNRSSRTLTLGRDRAGEKPLFWGRLGRSIAFGSELKALRAHPDCRGEIDRDALAVFLRHSYVPGAHSIYRGIQKVLPGHLVTVTPDRQVQSSPYWSMRAAVDQGAADPFPGTEAEAATELEGLLRHVVGQQMVSDVPLGAFLSGGIDSSLVVALMQAQSRRAVKTFTIKFEEAEYDESDHARAVANHLKTDHVELTVTAKDAQNVIPALPDIYDEPFSDSSQIPTFLVSQVARSQVTVSLSGDGGDEFFGGYPRYRQTLDLWKRLRWSPYLLRALAASALTSVKPPTWDRLFKSAPAMMRGRRSILHGDRLHKLAAILEHPSLEETYRRIVTHWPVPEDLVANATEAPTALLDASTWPSHDDELHRLMYLDAVTYLPDDILVKVDRAAMAVSLETRAPLVDHRVVEFAWRLPASYVYRGGVGKLPLKRILSAHVPASITDRPKMGFGIPLGEWLRGPLRPWAEGLLDSRKLAQQGFFDAAAIAQKWNEHQRGERRWHYLLWDVLMFQAWLERQ